MRYKAIVSYDGTNYSGWQKQKNGNSIQQELEKAFFSIVQTPVKITASGRTDGKVHAVGQVFHFDSDRNIDFRRAVNSQLPEDIFITSVEKADDDFHARYSAKWKHYD
ncbi:MAG: tRNA pseudouridine(38-40) synthase TruA, partial [Erysipelotrichaceae bacterium]|nr:tRNA pseudouridine(38-40) synthase TruA [Erysipelotrichaceae bacterium]